MRFSALPLVSVVALVLGCSQAVVRNPATEEAILSEVAGGTTGKYCDVEEKGKNAEGRTVTICHQLFQTRPYLHLEEERIQGKSIRLSGALIQAFGSDGQNGFALQAAEHRYPLVNAEGEPLTRLPKLAAQGLRTNFTIYHVTGTLLAGAPGTSGSIAVKSIAPRVLVTGCAIDGLFAGVWTGKAARRLIGQARSFDWFKPSIPVKITIHSMTPFKSLEDVADEGAFLKDGRVAVLVGTIDNMNREIRDDSGTYPNLAALGGGNPFSGAVTDRIEVQRYSSMHGPGLMNTVVNWPKDSLELGTNGMATVSVMDVAHLVSPQEDPKVAGNSVLPHGAPTGFILGDFHLVKAGDYRMSCPLK